MATKKSGALQHRSFPKFSLPIAIAGIAVRVVVAVRIVVVIASRPVVPAPVRTYTRAASAVANHGLEEGVVGMIGVVAGTDGAAVCVIALAGSGGRWCRDADSCSERGGDCDHTHCLPPLAC